jgi:acetyltransferase-like isoleucine patch superfamily enzyme
VTKDVPPGVVAMGHPCRVVRERSFDPPGAAASERG